MLLDLVIHHIPGHLALTLILYIIGVIGTLVFVFTADKFGRKEWQEYTFLELGLALFILAIYFIITRIAPSILLSPLFSIFYSANAGVTGQTTGAFVGELFHTRIRTTAMGAVTAISRAGAIISDVIFPITLKLYGIVTMEILLFIVGVVGFLITHFLREETTDKSLEELSH